MKSIKKLTSIFLVVLMLMVTVSLSASAYDEHICVKSAVGSNVSMFSRTYYFDESRGMITIGQDDLIFYRRAVVKTFHTTMTHHGNVELWNKVGRTQDTSARYWSYVAGVTVNKNGIASYRAYLGDS